MNVTFSSGGSNIPTRIFSPSVGNGGLIILAYGSDGLVDSKNGPWKTMIEGYAGDLAAHGFVAAIPDYFVRTGTHSGDLDPARPVAYMEQVLASRAAWQAVIEDAASKLAKPSILPGIDSSRVGYLGFSLGGHLWRSAESAQALVIFFAPVLEGLGLSNTLSLKAEIHHGENDFLAYSANAVLISKQLASLGADCHLWPSYPRAVHGFVGNDQANSNARKTSHERTMEFFKNNL